MRTVFPSWLAVAAIFALTVAAPIVALDDVSDARRAQEQEARDRHAERWDDFDLDGDGELNRQEWQDREWAYFMIYDLDGDERLSAAEYMRSFCGDPQSRIPQQIESCRAFVRQNLIVLGFTGSRDDGLERATGGPLLSKWFRVNDENRNGRVSRQEFYGGIVR